PDHEGDHPDDAIHEPRHLEGGVAEHRVDGKRLLMTHQNLELAVDLLPDGGMIEEEPRAGGEENQHGREREESEEGESGALRERAGLDRRMKRLGQDRAPDMRGSGFRESTHGVRHFRSASKPDGLASQAMVSVSAIDVPSAAGGRSPQTI